MWLRFHRCDCARHVHGHCARPQPKSLGGCQSGRGLFCRSRPTRLSHTAHHPRRQRSSLKAGLREGATRKSPGGIRPCPSICTRCSCPDTCFRYAPIWHPCPLGACHTRKPFILFPGALERAFTGLLGRLKFRDESRRVDRYLAT
jgi:hypothetical protein